MPTFETITLETDADGIAVLTLNRPDRLNAFNGQMMADIIAAIDATDADDAVKVVIVTGAGRGFCAGADLSGGGPVGGVTREEDRDKVQRDGAGRVTLRLFDSLKPIIAAVNGPAVGVGVTMQLAMDVRLASTSARFGMVFNRRGILLEGASSYFLPRLVGLQQALDWTYSGRVFGAQEAFDGGLVKSLHEPDDLMPAAKALAREYAEGSVVSAALTRQLMWRMLGASHPMEAHRAESRGLHLRRSQTDSREGVVSFLEKRPAVFKDTVGEHLPDIWPGWVDPEFF